MSGLDGGDASVLVREIVSQGTLVVPRLGLALLLGATLAVRPFSRSERPRREMVQTQVLMCVAGALIASVIGDSLARAFGVVGLGGFIRFRSGLKDPRDAAVLFVLIGLGMACGLGATAVAITGWTFVLALLASIDLWPRARTAGPERLWLRLEAVAPAAVPLAVSALQAEGFRTIASSAEGESVELWVEAPADPERALARLPIAHVRALSWRRAPGTNGPEGAR